MQIFEMYNCKTKESLADLSIADVVQQGFNISDNGIDEWVVLNEQETVISLKTFLTTPITKLVTEYFLADGKV